MNKTAKTLMCSLAALTMMAAAGGSYAQTPMKSDSMMKSHSMKMSKADMKMMKMCHAMDHDKMMADSKCKMMMEKHPDMMKSDGMMKK